MTFNDTHSSFLRMTAESPRPERCDTRYSLLEDPAVSITEIRSILTDPPPRQAVQRMKSPRYDAERKTSLFSDLGYLT